MSKFSALYSIDMVDFQMRINPDRRTPQKLVRNLPFIRYSAILSGREKRRPRFVHQIFTDEWLFLCLRWVKDYCEHWSAAAHEQEDEEEADDPVPE